MGPPTTAKPAPPGLPAPAAPAPDRRLGDLGNIVEFGHINLRVPDQPTALAFYVTGLGLTRDPHLKTGLGNAWINVGNCQFHLPVGPAQVLRGRIGLVLPDLDALVARLHGVAPRLAGTAFGFERAGAQVDITCPWGNRLRVHAPDARRFGRQDLGMPFVELDVAVGTAARIARFYEAVLDTPAHLVQDAAGLFARVPAGPGESLVYRETAQALPRYDGHHIQLTVAAFARVHRRLLAHGLVSEESGPHQYRFDRLIDPDSGALLTELQHEVRSMHHPLYARRLVHHDPPLAADAWSTVHGDGPGPARWRMPSG